MMIHFIKKPWKYQGHTKQQKGLKNTSVY